MEGELGSEIEGRRGFQGVPLYRESPSMYNGFHIFNSSSKELLHSSHLHKIILFVIYHDVAAIFCIISILPYWIFMFV